jgi:hypothetical protein
MLDEQDKAKDKLIGKTIASVRTYSSGDSLELIFTDGTSCEIYDKCDSLEVAWEEE